MDKNGFKQEEDRPTDYFSEVKAAQKQEKASVTNLVTALRSDMVPASNVQPAKKSILQRDNLKIAVGILLGIVIIGFILYIAIGAGRPALEQNLVSLANKDITPTPSPTPTTFLPTKTPIQPTNTPYPSPTIRPTNTPVVKNIVLPTQAPPTPTPTAAVCRDALSITLADVGQTLCVRGNVIETVSHPTDFMVIFSHEKNAFYWVSYDLVWSQAELDTCYKTNGTIDRIGNSPMLVFNYKNLPEACP